MIVIQKISEGDDNEGLTRTSVTSFKEPDENNDHKNPLMQKSCVIVEGFSRKWKSQLELLQGDEKTP